MKRIEISILLLLMFSIGIYSCKPSISEIATNNNSVSVKGKIENYKGIYKTGKLTYFDALTREVQDEIFTIDSTGNFDFSFSLAHPIINSIFFDIENIYYSDFLIEPNTNYNITFKEEKIQFNGESGRNNTQIFKFKDSLNLAFGERMAAADKLHQEGISIDKYIKFHKQLENEKLSFLASYSDQYKLSENVKSVLTSEIKFKTAHAWINYRFDYSEGSPKRRKSLPEDFYKKLFTEYSIQKKEDYQSRVCIDYISNIVSVLTNETIQNNDLINYFNSLNLYSPDEIDMLSQVYSGNKSIIDTDEYKSFMKINEQQLIKTNLKFNLQLLLKNTGILKKGLTRDLVLSQGVSRYYFSNNVSLTTDEWRQLEEKMENKSILNYLKEYGSEKTFATEGTNDSSRQELNSSLEAVKEKYINKYKGKVVYIDFYATWCGPCRDEVPYAKQLYQEFKNKGVVFLNLCARSKKEDWENFKKQYDVEGENYLLNNEEFYLLSEIYKVQGFPTYILLDKNGHVSDNNDLRPSDKKRLYDKIRELL